MPPQLALLSLDQFKAHVAKGDLPEGARLRKSFAGIEVKAADGEDRTLTIRITTGSKDRDNDTIDPKGWQLANYRRNPVVLFGHDYRSLPIAKDTGIVQDELGLLAKPQFTSKELNPLGDTCYEMLKAGFLNAASVGMNPLKYAFNEENRGLDFMEQELLEYSIVPVPANAEALQQGKSMGIDLSPLKAYAEELLDTFHGEAGIWLPRKSLERVIQLTNGNALVVAIPKGLKSEHRLKLSQSTGPIDFDELVSLSIKDADSGAPSDPPPIPPVDPPTPAAPAAPASVEDPALVELPDAPVEAAAGDFLTFEFEDAPAPTADLFDVDPEVLGAVIRDSVKQAVGDRLMANTGRLD